jgi:hypothetical protein
VESAPGGLAKSLSTSYDFSCQPFSRPRQPPESAVIIQPTPNNPADLSAPPHPPSSHHRILQHKILDVIHNLPKMAQEKNQIKWYAPPPGGQVGKPGPYSAADSSCGGLDPKEIESLRVSRLRNSLKKFSGLILSPSPLSPPLKGGENRRDCSNFPPH